jgi:hypothetical protein
LPAIEPQQVRQQSEVVVELLIRHGRTEEPKNRAGAFF